MKSKSAIVISLLLILGIGGLTAASGMPRERGPNRMESRERNSQNRRFHRRHRRRHLRRRHRRM